MEAELRAGVKLDLASGAELRELGDRLERALAEQLADPLPQRFATVLTATAGGLYGSAGAAFTDPGGLVYQVPDGMRAVFTVLRIRQAGAAANATLLDFYANNVTPSTFMASLSIPAATAGGASLYNGQNQAPQLGSGESLVASGTTAGAAGTQLAVTGQVLLYPTTGPITAPVS